MIDLKQQLFDFCRKEVDAAYDQHVIKACPNPSHPGRCSTAWTGSSTDAGEIACAITQERQGFFSQACKNQFALFSIWQVFTAIWINYLNQKMIFPDVQASALGGSLPTFHGNARTHDFAQSVNIQGLYAKLIFNLSAHCLGPRFSAEHAYFKLDRLKRNTLFFKGVADIECVRGRRTEG